MREMKGEKGGSRFDPGDADVGPHQLAPMGSDDTGFEALERYRTRQGVKRKTASFGVKPQGSLPKIRMPEGLRSEEHTSELQSLMRNSYAVFCLKKKKKKLQLKK